MKKAAFAATLLAALSTPALAQDPSPLCSELNWSAQVLAANPDIGESCRGVYELNGKYYAKVEIELTRVRGNRLTFKPRHTDGSMGKPRSIRVNNSWRADIDGRSYRADELLAGQRLNVYIPEDRFALGVDDGDFAGEEELVAIEEAAVVTEMPKTASPLFAALGAGVTLLAAGGALTTRRLRRRRA